MTLLHFYYDPVSEFNRLFEDALAARLCHHASASSTETNRHSAPKRHEIYRPRLDVYESKDNTVSVTFELPGLTSDNVTIDVHQNRLIVSGEFPTSDSTEGERAYAVRERCSGKFSRTLQLPFGTKPEDVNAKMENGVLTITFPKTSPEQEPKRVTVL
ncbi:small heat shock protein [Chiua virens]|nr:small heat shock protein [Chiua virens]